MSAQFYKILHIAAVMLLFISLGAAAFHSATGGTKATNPLRARVAATHGIALLVIFVAGFGVAGKAGWMSDGFPGWIAAKLVLWLLFGASIVLTNRAAGSGKWLWWAFPALGAVSAWLAIAKPF
jgi:hypothetical protein